MTAFSRSTALLCIFVLPRPLLADVILPQVFGDSMVLQSDASLPIWGIARPGESVAVSLDGDQRRTVADDPGQWRVTFPPRRASANGVELVVRGDNLVRCRNVVVGEVWICAGQSNMAWPLKQAKDGPAEAASAQHPQIRLLHLAGGADGGSKVYTPEQIKRLTPEGFIRGRWSPCMPEAAADSSAVAYFFGRRIEQDLKAPIGLIMLAVGGTPAEAWIRRAALDADPSLRELTQGDWLDNAQLELWCQERARTNLARAIASGEIIPGDDLGMNHPFKPAFMWQAGVEPLIPFAIRGVIWYQGESNAESAWRVEQHTALFPQLVSDWRAQWGQGDFSFLFVQLPAMGRPHWPAFRESQRRCLDKLTNLGMAVTIDAGHPTDVHPPDKRPVGERLARWALANTYGRSTAPSGPLFSSSTSGEKASVTFLHASGLETRDGLSPVGFEVAGEDGVWRPADAQIVGENVEVCCGQISPIIDVRYGWAPFPNPPLNLINREGLPASPFSTASEHEERPWTHREWKN